MTEWQQIETAPRDGSQVLITNGKQLAIGEFTSCYESELKLDGTLGVDAKLVKNPNAGKWMFDYWYSNGCTAYGDNQAFDLEGPIGFDPTHWMPLPDPPNP